jgi:hypothetical protein
MFHYEARTQWYFPAYECERVALHSFLAREPMFFKRVSKADCVRRLEELHRVHCSLSGITTLFYVSVWKCNSFEVGWKVTLFFNIFLEGVALFLHLDRNVPYCFTSGLASAHYFTSGTENSAFFHIRLQDVMSWPRIPHCFTCLPKHVAIFHCVSRSYV